MSTFFIVNFRHKHRQHSSSRAVFEAVVLIVSTDLTSCLGGFNDDFGLGTTGALAVDDAGALTTFEA